MQELSNSTALLLIDVQKGFDLPGWGSRNNPQAEDNMLKLLTAWRKTGRPVVHVRHMSVEPNSHLRPGQEGNEFKDAFVPLADEHVEEKTVNSAFIGTRLTDYLQQNGYETVVIVGLTTDHCVSTSTRMSGNLGFNTIVVADATATFDRTGYDGTNYPADQVHKVALASLHNEFANVTTTEEILTALQARTAK